jgi:hypothetical protein
MRCSARISSFPGRAILADGEKGVAGATGSALPCPEQATARLP